MTTQGEVVRRALTLGGYADVVVPQDRSSGRTLERITRVSVSQPPVVIRVDLKSLASAGVNHLRRRKEHGRPAKVAMQREALQRIARTGRVAEKIRLKRK